MESLEDRLYLLDFSIQRSIRYHHRRRAFFDRCATVSDTLAVIFGSATIFALLNQVSDILTAVFAATVTVSSAVNLVVGSSRMARQHHDLARRFIDIEKQMATTDPAGEDDYRRWVALRLTVETDEPPALRVLDTICHNDVIRAMGLDPAHLIPIQPWQRRLAQFVDFRDHEMAQVVYDTPPKH